MPLIADIDQSQDDFGYVQPVPDITKELHSIPFELNQFIDKEKYGKYSNSNEEALTSESKLHVNKQECREQQYQQSIYVWVLLDEIPLELQNHLDGFSLEDVLLAGVADSLMELSTSFRSWLKVKFEFKSLELDRVLLSWSVFWVNKVLHTSLVG